MTACMLTWVAEQARHQRLVRRCLAPAASSVLFAEAGHREVGGVYIRPKEVCQRCCTAVGVRGGHPSPAAVC